MGVKSGINVTWGTVKPDGEGTLVLRDGLVLRGPPVGEAIVEAQCPEPGAWIIAGGRLGAHTMKHERDEEEGGAV